MFQDRMTPFQTASSDTSRQGGVLSDYEKAAATTATPARRLAAESAGSRNSFQCDSGASASPGAEPMGGYPLTSSQDYLPTDGRPPVNAQPTSRKPSTPIRESNIDLFLFAAKCMADGDTLALQQAGLTLNDIPQLRQLSLSQLIAMSEQGSELSAFLRRARQESQRSELARALMEQGAPRELMMALFRMSTRRYSAERMRLGVAGPRGRPMTAHMDAGTEQAIWRLWVTLGNERQPGQLRHADDWLLISREVPGHLRSAWSLIQRWARDPGARSAFRGDRIRLTMTRLSQSELELRHKHGLEAPVPVEWPEINNFGELIQARAA